jgi:hypothetical protein
VAINSGFFNSTAGDRKYDAEDVNKFFDGVITDGVLSAIGDTLVVVPSSGMQIAAGSGKAWFLKSWIENTADAFLTLSAADVTYDRIDIIALDFNKSDAVRENDIIIVEGTPSGTPTPPTLVDTATHLQKPLAHIYVEANETVIQAGDITDKVGTVDCPFSQGVVDLIVEVDDITIQISANELSVKDNGITATQIATGTITANEIATNTITAAKIGTSAITSDEIAPNAVIGSKIAGDSIDGTKIANSAINSEHYWDGSIDRVHLANDIIDGSKIANDVINSEHYAALSIDREHLANDIIDGSKIANDVINSEHYVAGSIDNEHLANDSVTAAKIGAGQVGSSEIATGAVGTSEIATDGVGAAEIQTGAVQTAKIAALAVQTSRINDNAVTTEKIANNAVDYSKVGDGVPMLTRRQGGHGSNWNINGTTNYTPTAVKMQTGVRISGLVNPGAAEVVTVTFPQAFASIPLVLVSAHGDDQVTAVVRTMTNTQATFWARNNSGAPEFIHCVWLAIGPE